jgi:hypothetical protein
MSPPIPGTCRYCGCTDEHPCDVPPYGTGDTCSWLSGTDRTVCSGTPCVIAWHHDQKAARAKARKHPEYAGWGYGAIVEDLRRKARRRRSGKDRAA